MKTITKIGACLIPLDGGRLHQLLKLGLNFITKFFADVAAEILLAEVYPATQRAFASNQLDEFATERGRGAQHDVAAVQEARVHVLAGCAQACEIAPPLAEDLKVAAGHFGKGLQATRLNDELSSNASADESAEVGGDGGGSGFDEREKLSAGILYLEHGVCGALHLLQLLAAQRLAHCGCSSNGDHHDLRARQDVIELHGSQVLSVADALHHAGVVERV